MTLPAQVLLFDLDGTLIDSAPDLAGAANDLRAQQGLPPLPLMSLRPMVGAGARGMVGLAFGLTPEDAGYDEMRDAFLSIYANRLLQLTHVFEQMAPVLNKLDAHQIRWGIVTNKAMRFTAPIAQGLGLDRRAAVLIAGDTTPHAKPHPEPLLEAARRLGVTPSQCAYVGDDRRDIIAGRAAGMASLAAAWGYLGQGDPVQAWGADEVLDSPAALLHWLNLA